MVWHFNTYAAGMNSSGGSNSAGLTDGMERQYGANGPKFLFLILRELILTNSFYIFTL